MSDDLLIVRVAGERVAMAAMAVESVVELGEVVPVPCAPEIVAGLTTLRSRTLTVIDVAQALGLPSRGSARFAVVLEIAGVGYALSVDLVENVIPAESEIQPVKVKLAPAWAHSAIGMVDTSVGTVLLLDLTRLVGGDPERKAA
jgi:chemotaxis signal transduction protein